MKQRSDIPRSWMRSEHQDSRPPGSARTRPMNAQQLLQEISDYCRQTGLAESTFGRRAVNDGKLANRLRNGGRITTDTLDRIRAFMTDNRSDIMGRPRVIPRGPDASPAIQTMPSLPAGLPPAIHRIGLAAKPGEGDPQRN